MTLARIAATVCLIACAAFAVGCGDDDEPISPQLPAEPAPGTATGEKTGDGAPTTAETEERKAPPSPEDQPGGAGDEEPIRSEAAFTGRSGRISPAEIAVPPFISVLVRLRSGDGREYVLRIGGRTLRARGEGGSAEALLDGLRTGKRYVGRPEGGGARVVIVASAEPGP